jgi:hypothetical protein
VGNKGYLQSEIRIRAAKGMGSQPENSSMYYTCIKAILFHRLFNNAFSIETIQCQMGRSQIIDDELDRAGSYYNEICVEGLRKTMRTFCQNS